MYIRLDTRHDGVHPFPIARSWKEVSGHVDAVLSYGDKIYIIQVKEKTPLLSISTKSPLYQEIPFITFRSFYSAVFTFGVIQRNVQLSG